MGVAHGGTSPPEFGVKDANANCPPPQIFVIGTKRDDVDFKIRQNPFWPGLCPEPHWGSSRRSPDPSRLERGHPSPYLIPLGTDPPSTLTIRPPENSSQIYAVAYAVQSQLYGSLDSYSCRHRRQHCYQWRTGNLLGRAHVCKASAPVLPTASIS